MPAIARWCSFASLVVTLAVAGAAHAQPVAPPDGRWLFTLPVVQYGLVSAPTATASGQEMVLDLRQGPQGVLTGTVSVALRMPLTVTQPWHRVEIANGVVDGATVSFSAWQYDQYRNTLRYTGVVERDVLRLTITRETPRGPERREVVARRSAF